MGVGEVPTPLSQIAAPVLPAELERQFRHWRWLVGANAEALCMTVMGDWIFTHQEGSIWLLDTIEADVRVVAPGLARLESLLDSPDERDALILEGLALAVLDGQRLPAEHCLGWRVPPVLGGATDRSNLAVVPSGPYQEWMGGLHKALRAVPGGRKVLGVEIAERGEIRVRWE